MSTVINGDSGVSIDYTTGAPRITGDFSNATIANRVMFQTSTVNGGTRVSAIPNGTGNFSQVSLHAASDPTNGAQFQINQLSTEANFNATYAGTGAYLPMTFYTGGSERMRIDTSGNVGIGIAPKARLDVYTASITGGGPVTSGSAADPDVMARFSGASVCMDFGAYASGAQWIQCRSLGNYSINYDLALQPNGGNTLHVGPNGGLGYGTGSGGTVTQATSRTTAVTLNKPTGRITMFTAAGTATWQYFTVNNSLVGINDTIVLSVSGATNVYSLQAIGLANGSFIIAFAAVLGTASDTPAFNFAIIKGATA